MERRKEALERRTADLSREIEFQDDQHEVEREELLDDGVASNRSISSEKTREYINDLQEVDMRRSATTQVKINMGKELCDDIRTMTFNVQQSLNLPKPELLTLSENPADYCKFFV